MFNDIRHGVRMLLKSPGFTAVAVLTLALGIGANTAIFSVVNAVLLRPLPYPQSDRLVQLLRHHPRFLSSGETVSASNFLFWQQHSQAFEGMAAFDILGTGFNLSAGAEPEHVAGVRVSADFFRVLGVNPILGRGFASEEDRPGGPNVVVISNSLWKYRLGGDAAIVGKTISLSGDNYTVVGVMPPGFWSRPSADAWVPLRPVFKPRGDEHEEGPIFVVLGRLKANSTLEHAQADMQRVGKQLAREFPDSIGFKDETVVVVGYHDRLVGNVRPALLVLLGAVGLVLLIACANVANLLLALAAARGKEMALRAALGADRFRLVRQLLTESTLLAFAGGGCGLLLSSWGLKGLLALVPGGLPEFSDVGIDGRVLTLTLLIALLTGIFFGLAPAFQTARIDLNDSLREGGGRTTGGVRHSRLRNGLVVAEISLSLVLLVGAALLIQTFANLRGVNPGFDPGNLLTMKLSLTASKYDTTAAVGNFFRQVVEHTEALPGVEAAAFVTNLPLEPGPDTPFQIEGQDEAYRSALIRAITPDYFRAMRIPMRQGRFFTDADNARSSGVVIVNEALARQYFPQRNPLGEHLTPGGIVAPRPYEVVGVVGDVREEGLDKQVSPTLFVPTAQVVDAATLILNRIFPASFVVRTKVEPTSLSAVVRKEVLAVDSMQPLFNVRPMEELLADSIARQQFNMLLLAIFAAIALLLATVGIYGVISYSVSQRTHEIGIRMALGAQKDDVLKLVVRQGVVLALVGVALGLTAAFVLTRLLSSFLFGVSASDPVIFAAVSLLLTGVVLLASYIPAWRTTKVDPMVALRYE